MNYYGRKYSVIYKKYQNENLALQECIRPVHGERASHHIMQMKKDFFVIPEFTSCNFQEELAKICRAHTMDREWLQQNLERNQVKGDNVLNAQYVAMLLRVADYFCGICLDYQKRSYGVQVMPETILRENIGYCYSRRLITGYRQKDLRYLI